MLLRDWLVFLLLLCDWVDFLLLVCDSVISSGGSALARSIISYEGVLNVFVLLLVVLTVVHGASKSTASKELIDKEPSSFIPLRDWLVFLLLLCDRVDFLLLLCDCVVSDGGSGFGGRLDLE